MKFEEIRLRTLFVILVGIVCYGIALFMEFNPWIPALTGCWIATIIIAVERKLSKISVKGLIIGVLGLAGGVIIANLIAYPILWIVPLKSFSPFILFLINLVFATIGLAVSLKRKEEIANFLFRFTGKKTTAATGKYKILDTSVIIDGRIVDLCETGFIEGILVIPHFVLTELQQIADSSSSTKRTRGRRGLDIVHRLQNQETVPVEIVDTDFPDILEVDSKLLQLAKVIKGLVITNDYNLKKVAKIKDVEVLNINEIATALKPILLPGESLRINILKEGENPNQGIAYLEDGTMVVVEKGKKYIGREAEIIVTSVLQTTTGKMIFTELKQEANKNKIKVKRVRAKGQSK